MDITTINIALEAKSVKEIMQMQLLNNTVNNCRYNYQTPVWTGKSWVVWFFADLNQWNDPRELKGDALKLAKGEL